MVGVAVLLSVLVANKQQQQQPLACPIVDRRVVGGEGKAQQILLTLVMQEEGGKREALPLYGRFLVIGACSFFFFDVFLPFCFLGGNGNGMDGYGVSSVRLMHHHQNNKDQ